LIVTLGTLVGIAQAAPAPPRPAGCNPDGRFICISIDDVDDVSHSVGAPSSVGAIDRYTEYTVRVSNGGTSALTNGSAKVDLYDLVGDTVVATQGQFVAAPSGCTPSGASTSFTCSLPNLGASGFATLHFFARTSPNTSADAMRLTVLASFTERASDSEGPASQPDTFSVPERTSLEPNPEFSASVYFAGSQNVVLATTPGAGGQSSVFRVPSTVGFSISQLVTLKEISSGETGYFCPVAACFGQTVATAAPGIFSATNPANVVTTLNATLLPKGVTEKSLIVHHTGSASFTTECSGALFTQPAASQVLPCRRVVIDKKAGIVTIDSWDNHQGDWGFS
jgi:hypothetical protein